MKTEYSIQEIQELQRIERECAGWKTPQVREIAIWEEIAHRMNCYESNTENHLYWCRIMDLFHKKYRCQ